MQTVTDINVLDKLVVVNLDVHIWSATRKLTPHDLGDANLPPEELASLGSKKVCNPENLNIFKTLKARAESLLKQNGIKFLGGWTIPCDKLDKIDQTLASIKSDFESAKISFLHSYEQAVQEWIRCHPGWEEIIANSIVSEDYVRAHLDFRWQIFRISVPEKSSSMDCLEQDIKNLGCTLYDEIARFAMETWKNCYDGKTEVTRKALSPFKSMYDKLIGLTFIEPRVMPIANLIQTALDSIPTKGPIAGSTLLMLQGLLALLKTPDQLVEHGQKILDGQNASSLLGTLIAKNPDINKANVSESGNTDFNPYAVNPVLESCGLW